MAWLLKFVTHNCRLFKLHNRQCCYLLCQSWRLLSKFFHFTSLDCSCFLRFTSNFTCSKTIYIYSLTSLVAHNCLPIWSESPLTNWWNSSWLHLVACVSGMVYLDNSFNLCWGLVSMKFIGRREPHRCHWSNYFGLACCITSRLLCCQS